MPVEKYYTDTLLNAWNRGRMSAYFADHPCPYDYIDRHDAAELAAEWHRAREQTMKFLTKFNQAPSASTSTSSKPSASPSEPPSHT